MKKLLFLLFPLLILFIIVTVITFIFIRNSQKNKQFLLLKDVGDVYYKTDQDYILLEQDEITLNSGTYIKTTEANAQVILPDNSVISIDSNTEIQINVSKTSTEINQLVGSTWHRVQSLSGNKSYEVVTPDVVAAVRGTIFGVDTGSSESQVFVVDSKVEIGKYKLEKGKRIIELRQELKSGELGNLLDGKFSVKNIPDDIKNKEWFKKNLIIDEKFKAVKPKEIRKKLKEELQNNEELNQLNTLIRSKIQTNVSENWNDNKDEYIETLKTKYDITLVGQEVCTKINETDIKSDIEKVQASKIISDSKKEILVNYLTILKEACGDTYLDQAEIDQLRNISINIGQVEGTSIAVQSDDFNTEIMTMLDYYLMFPDPDPSGICIKYSDKTIDNIVAELTAIENKYNMQPVAGEQNREKFTSIQNACRDNIITNEEMTIIQSK